MSRTLLLTCSGPRRDSFEHEEGRLEALHAFRPLVCDLRPPPQRKCAREVGEPSDLFLHNLEHRGSWGNAVRALYVNALLLLVVSLAFVLLLGTATIRDVVTEDTKAARCRDVVFGDSGRTAVCLDLSALAVRFLPAVVAVGVNLLLCRAVDKLAMRMRPTSATGLMYSTARSVWFFQLVNTGLVPLLVTLAARIRAHALEAGTELRWYELGSSSQRYDFALDEEWYELTASTVLLTLLSFPLSSAAYPVLRFAKIWVKKRVRRPITVPQLVQNAVYLL